MTFFFFIGGFFAMMIRLHLLTPNGYLLTPDQYNRMFTMHGVTMIFFFLIPSIPAVMGNFLIPLMIGAKDLAFPKINLLSWYIYIIGGAFTLWSMINGGLDTGWTFYTPLSTLYSNSAVAPAVVGVFITGFSSILTGLEFPGDGAHDARAGNDVVPAAAVCVGALCDVDRHDPGDAGDCDYPGTGGHGTGIWTGILQSGDGRGSDSVPAPVLVLLASGRVHHDSAGDGCDQRTDSDIRAQAAVRVPLRGRGQPGHCGDRFPGLDASHVRHWTVDLRGGGVFVPDVYRGDTVGNQDV